MRIGVIVAMDKEFVQLRSILSDAEEKTVERQTFVIGKTGDKEVILQKCGIGKVNAAVGTAELIRTFHPDYVISTGVAGGIDSRYIEPQTLCSRKYRGLYICGELLDADGDCGGFNLHFAVGSALKAAGSIKNIS